MLYKSREESLQIQKNIAHNTNAHNRKRKMAGGIVGSGQDKRSTEERDKNTQEAPPL